MSHLGAIILHLAILLLSAPLRGSPPIDRVQKAEGETKEEEDGRLGRNAQSSEFAELEGNVTRPHCLVRQKTPNSTSYFASTSIRLRRTQYHPHFMSYRHITYCCIFDFFISLLLGICSICLYLESESHEKWERAVFA